MWVRVVLPTAAVATIAALAVVCSGQPAAEPAQAAASAPNFLVVMVDDQALNTFRQRFMPHTFRHLVRGGTRLATAFALPPLCCPARAGFQTGQYPHNHGVFGNNPGYPAFIEPGNQIASWLQAAGYRTGLVGKYMNGFVQVEPVEGYDYWWVAMGNPSYVRYTVSDQGVERRYQGGRRVYFTSKVTQNALGFLREQAGSDQPFFLWVSHYAPHWSVTRHRACGDRSPLPLRSDWRRWRHLRMPKGPGFNEGDISDKLAIHRRQKLNRAAVQAVERRYRCTVAALQPVDRSVSRMVRTLRELGQLDRTVIVYLSDNGYYFGEHRIPEGKGRPLEEALRVPMAVRVPEAVLGARPPRRIRRPLSNLDLAPTILELAGAEPCTGEGDCRVMDGRSFAPLLRGEGGWPPRSLLLELRNECDGGYRGLRTPRYLYVRWYSRAGDCTVIGHELYDTRRDPHQLRNLLSRRALRGPGGHRFKRIAERLEGRLERLGECAGVAGRDEPGETPVCG